MFKNMFRYVSRYLSAHISDDPFLLISYKFLISLPVFSESVKIQHTYWPLLPQPLARLALQPLARLALQGNLKSVFAVQSESVDDLRLQGQRWDESKVDNLANVLY